MSAPRNQNIYAACGFIYFYRLSAHKIRMKGTQRRLARRPRAGRCRQGQNAQLRKAAGRVPFGFAFHFPRPGRRRSSQSIEPHLYCPFRTRPPSAGRRHDDVGSDGCGGRAALGAPAERRRRVD